MRLLAYLLPVLVLSAHEKNTRRRKRSATIQYNGTTYVFKQVQENSQLSTKKHQRKKSAKLGSTDTKTTVNATNEILPTTSLPCCDTSVTEITTHTTTGARSTQTANENQQQSNQNKPTQNNGSPGSSLAPSKQEFVNAVKNSGYSEPTENQFKSFAKGIDSKTFSSKREVAMFLAQILWESDGLRAKSEIRCAGNQCVGEYRSPGDPENKFYYGRGYIQLTWSYNYKSASQEIFNNLSLYENPDQVATNEDISWGVSFWFWRANVHSDPGVQQGQFGASTKKINGGLECGANTSNGKAEKRFQIYTKVLKSFGIKENPDPAGC